MDLLTDFKLDSNPQQPQPSPNPNIWGATTAGAAANTKPDWFGGASPQQPVGPSQPPAKKKEEFLDLLG